MEKRGTQTMVRTFSTLMTFVTLFSAIAQAAQPELLLHWKPQSASGCQKLIESFLSELRALASDHTIELDTAEKHEDSDAAKRHIDLSCEDGTRVRVESQGNVVFLRYLAKAQGFDAADWLPFQQKFLR